MSAAARRQRCIELMQRSLQGLVYQVRFLNGRVEGTLSSAFVEKLAILRLDRDMCESTMGAGWIKTV